jgi:hypothetical protein
LAQIAPHNTEQGIVDAVFGVPSFVVDGALFWGADASAIMLDYLSNPTLFQSTEMCRISDMSMGIELK